MKNRMALGFGLTAAVAFVPMLILSNIYIPILHSIPMGPTLLELAFAIGGAFLAAKAQGDAKSRPVFLVQAVAIVIARRVSWWQFLPFLPWSWTLLQLVAVAAGTIVGVVFHRTRGAAGPGAPSVPVAPVARSASGAPLIDVVIPQLPGTATQGLLPIRSIAEEHLYMQLNPCACGETAFEQKHGIYGSGSTLSSRFEGPCKKCGGPRRFEFKVLDDPAKQPAWPSYGGPEPSKIIDPGQWLSVSDRLAKSVPGNSHTFAEPQRGEAKRMLQTAVACHEEVLKFLPPGAEEVPESAFFTAAGRAYRAAEPGRFRGYRLEAVVQVYRDMVKKHG
jgi:hypothetical protein